LPQSNILVSLVERRQRRVLWRGCISQWPDRGRTGHLNAAWAGTHGDAVIDIILSGVDGGYAPRGIDRNDPGMGVRRTVGFPVTRHPPFCAGSANSNYATSNGANWLVSQLPLFAND
jgi:hypothetical protein